jgi:hypothetical protein
MDVCHALYLDLELVCEVPDIQGIDNYEGTFSCRRWRNIKAKDIKVVFVYNFFYHFSLVF